MQGGLITNNNTTKTCTNLIRDQLTHGGRKPGLLIAKEEEEEEEKKETVILRSGKL